MNSRYLTDYPDVLMPEEAQSILGVGRNTIYKLLSSGALKSLKIGKLYRIPKKYLMEYLYPCYNDNSDWSVVANQEGVM